MILFFHKYFVQELFALFFFSRKMPIPLYKVGSISFFAIAHLRFIKSSDLKTFYVNVVHKILLPPFLVIFSGQRTLSTPFPTATATFHVITAPDMQSILRKIFILISIVSNTRGGLLTFFIDKKSQFFSFLKRSSCFIFQSLIVALLNENCGYLL